MVTEEPLDLTKKKKKSSKKGVDVEGDAAVANSEAPAGAGGEEDMVLDLTSKKKKPKKVKEGEDDAAVPAVLNDGEELAIDFTKLKKKKKRTKGDADADGAAAKTEAEKAKENFNDLERAMFELGHSNLIDAKADWPDYSYDQLLDHVFGIMREKNPDLTDERARFVMRPPLVARAGSKKTAFTNFADICRCLNRDQRHVLSFLFAELGVHGSVDGNQCLIIKGRFQQKHFENVLRKYIKEYVKCHTCRSAETELTRDTRLMFLQCKICGSRCSVAPVRTGFTAQVGRRAAARRAAEQAAGR